jgi:hypothetical protein
LLKGDAAADGIVAAQAALKRGVEPRAFVDAFLATISAPGAPPRPPFPDPLPATLEKGIRTTMMARPQGEAEIPVDALRETSFRKLVTSGGHHPVFEGIRDKLHRELKAERAIIRGAGHNVPFTGAPFNERLEAFLKSV